MFTYITPCLPDWLDYNGHMNDACYGRVFSDAIDAMMDDIGLDAAYRARTKGTLYTVEDHRWYEQEVRAGAALEVQTLVLDFDAKRLHIWQGLFVAAQRCAACETMLLHISQAGEAPKAAPLPAGVQAVLGEHQAAYQAAHGAEAPLKPRAARLGLRR